MKGHGRLCVLLIMLLQFSFVCASASAEQTEGAKPIEAKKVALEAESSIARIKNDLREKNGASGNLVKDSLSAWSPEEKFDSQSTAWKALKALGLCLGFFFVGIGVLKRCGKSGRVVADTSMQILDRLPLSSKTTLLLVRIREREVLFTIGSEQVASCSMDFKEHNSLGKEKVEVVCKEDLKLSA